MGGDEGEPWLGAPRGSFLLSTRRAHSFIASQKKLRAERHPLGLGNSNEVERVKGQRCSAPAPVRGKRRDLRATDRTIGHGASRAASSRKCCQDASVRSVMLAIVARILEPPRGPEERPRGTGRRCRRGGHGR